MTKKRTVKELEEQAKQDLVEEHDEVLVGRIKEKLRAINSIQKDMKKAQKQFEETQLHSDEDVVKKLDTKLVKVNEEYAEFLEKGILVVA